MKPSARRRALELLAMTDPAAKAALTRALFERIDEHEIDPQETLDEPANLPGRPELPRLVPAKDVPTRSPFTSFTTTSRR